MGKRNRKKKRILNPSDDYQTLLAQYQQRHKTPSSTGEMILEKSDKTTNASSRGDVRCCVPTKEANGERYIPIGIQENSEIFVMSRFTQEHKFVR